MGKTPSFPRKRESRSLKLLLSPTDCMPASAGITNYDTVFCGRGLYTLLFMSKEGGRNRLTLLGVCTLLTTKLAPSDWGKISDPVTAAAILDRLSLNGKSITFEERSYRE